ncbi:MAG: ABC-2 type transport system permease protein [Candidatus Kentron sp. G]|nr:MAG: ABC-2 type transport system permease protein [Candidatus Kentron sp. G]VFM96831.1 MAG: ABC-2 type transport system permease protein [Candidatus Kentron sp. G]VFM97022.1 MAG: ABC-2 type transport system permease protein [Candidatus Kentron sp. G]
MSEIRHIARKEFTTFFSSPAAFLFLGAFLAVTLFVFFWVETFFARNLADIRPLFQWMPVLLIFLVGALTMRAWSEERRSGTLESLLTSPVRPIHLVLGKFLAEMALVAVALTLTLPLPLTAALLGPLDWGPVLGGYVAALFLAAAYVAIGLTMSARTDNAIVALILTVAVSGLFLLVGTPKITTLFGHSAGGVLALLGSGARFESITRGVLDLRDLYYYLSIIGIFLILNLYSLEKLRWAGNPRSGRHRKWALVSLLAVANFVVGNFWLYPLGWARIDMTDGKLYSLSEATEQYLTRLHEPLFIRGYFSANTHPLLMPLVPQLRDLLAEYAVTGKGRVRVEFIDPQEDPLLEEEAASKYGIRPVPFQMASRYQTSVVNSYFDLVIAYGDQFETLGYQDLIEIKARGEGDLDVILNNPEYAITQSIRKVLTTYQAGGNPFDTLTDPVTFRGYLSPNENLPEILAGPRADLNAILADHKKTAGDKLIIEFQDPDANGGALGKELEERFGFGPQIASLFDPKPFWFYMVLEGNGETVQIPLPAELSKEELERAIEAGLKRMAPGFLKTVALSSPVPAANSFPGADAGSYSQLRETLTENVRIRDTTLEEGRVPLDADFLMVLAPQGLEEKQVFAIDQFLMQGGTVVLATSAFDIGMSQYLSATKNTSGLEDWLAHMGLGIGEKLVLDPDNAALPVPVRRYIGPLAVHEIRMLPYPFFPDLREAGLNAGHPITAALGQMTLNWPSPITVDAAKNQGRQVFPLLTSSGKSWTSEEMEVAPDYEIFPDLGFARSEQEGAQLLAVAVEDRFESFFKDRESPLAQKEQSTDDATAQNTGDKTGEETQDTNETITGVIARSPESARIILIAANNFASDEVLMLASEGLGTLYTKPIEFLQNAVDWALEDQSLLAMRSRARFARTLAPMDRPVQMLVEYGNYALALLGLVLVWFWRRQVRKANEVRYRMILAG